MSSKPFVVSDWALSGWVLSNDSVDGGSDEDEDDEDDGDEEADEDANGWLDDFFNSTAAIVVDIFEITI